MDSLFSGSGLDDISFRQLVARGGQVPDDDPKLLGAARRCGLVDPVAALALHEPQHGLATCGGVLVVLEHVNIRAGADELRRGGHVEGFPQRTPLASFSCRHAPLGRPNRRKIMPQQQPVYI